MKLSLQNKNKENSKKLQSSLIKETGCQNPNNFQTVISHPTLCVSFILFSFIYLSFLYINWKFHIGMGVLTKSTPIYFPRVPPLRASSSLHVCSPHPTELALPSVCAHVWDRLLEYVQTLGGHIPEENWLSFLQQPSIPSWVSVARGTPWTPLLCSCWDFDPVVVLSS